MTKNRRRIEKMQTTLMKLIAQLESCKLILDDIEKANSPPTEIFVNYEVCPECGADLETDTKFKGYCPGCGWEE
jgi:uncharacterized protein with PIN domain